jgi:cytochrome c oxidase subunit 2
VRRRGIGVAACSALALLASACSTSFGLPRGATEQGRHISDLWQSFMTAGVIVAAIVYALIGWSLIRYRKRRHERDDELGRQFHANVPLEIVYTAIPVLIVIGLFLLSFRTEDQVDAVSADPDVVLSAQAFSWGWRFEYPALGVSIVSAPSGEGVPGPDIYLPVGETIRVDLSSRDVIHAFWVPGFNFKRDAIPGNPTTFDLTPERQGTFRGVCAEFCGLNHAFMGFTVHVVSHDAFMAWIATQAGATIPAVAPPGGTG